MNRPDPTAWPSPHRFDEVDHTVAERSTRWVLLITLCTMAVEIGAGWWFNSMALLADGWHMSSHAVAMGLTVLAYRAARRYAQDPRFAFGTWKIEILAGYTSALGLVGVAVVMVEASVTRLVAPQPIQYAEALGVAVLGLLVNLACARLLGHAHHAHDHDHDHDHDAPDEPAQDLNLKSAYVHVLADAATSVLALLALWGGWWWGWTWLDPVMGIVGAALMLVWARGLIRQTGRILLDCEMDHPVVGQIRGVIQTLNQEGPGRTALTDLHVWRVGRHAFSCALTVVTENAALTPDALRARLAVCPAIVHSTLEVHRAEPHTESNNHNKNHSHV